MDSKDFTDILDVKKFLTFSSSRVDDFQVIFCFTVRPSFSDSDYLLYRKWNISENQISRKSVKFVPGKTIKSHSFSPDGNWQAVLTGQGGIYILPVNTILGEVQESRHQWANDDATSLNTRLAGQPECMVWWRSFRNDDIAVVGCKTGQIMLIDLSNGSYLTQVDVQGHIDLVELVRTNDNSTVYCLITSRTGNQWKLTLEEQQTAILTKASESADDFDEVDVSTHQSCIYIQGSNCLAGGGNFDPVKMYQFPQSVRLRYQCYENKHFVSGFNSNKNRLHIYDAGALESPALFIFRISETAMHVLIHETLIYAVYKTASGHLKLGIYCRQHAHCPDGEDVSVTFSAEDARRAKLADFDLGDGPLTGLYLLPNCLKPEFHSSYNLSQWTDIPPVLAVTKKSVFLIHQKDSYDEHFLDLLLRQRRQRDAEWLGVGLKLDLNWLYHMAAEEVCAQDTSVSGIIAKSALKTAGEYFGLARTPVHQRIQCLSKYFTVKDLLRYLSGLMRNPDQLTSIERGCVSNGMILCFARILAEDPNDHSTSDKYKAFVLNNFHFNQMRAVYVLLDFGLVSEALFLCRERGLLVEAMQHLQNHEWACHTAQCKLPIDDALRDALIVQERNNILRSVGPADMEVLALSSPQLLTALAEECIRWCDRDLDDDVLANLLECFSPYGVTVQRLVSFIEEPDSRERSQTMFSISMLNSLDSLYGNESSLKPVVGVVLRAFIAMLLRQQQSKVHILEFISLWQRSRVPSIKRAESTTPPVMGLSLNQVAAVVCFSGILHIYGGPELPVRSFKRRVREVALGGRHALVLDSNCVLFSCGNNMYGQLGVDPTCTAFPGTSMWRPSLCPLVDLPPIRSVVAGHYHSLALTSEGSQILAWGWNVHGQLGTGSVEDSWKPQRVELGGGGCVALSAGAQHSMALRDDGRLFMFGGNQFGQLARDNIMKSVDPIPMLDLRAPIKLIATKYFHSVCVTTDNRIYQWGINPNVWSAIGERAPMETICQPHRLKLRVPSQVTQIACGANHSIALCADGTVHTTGKNFYGQLGTGNKQHLVSDMAMVGELVNVSHIAADENVSMALDTQGRLCLWGQASHPAAECFSRPGSPDFLHPVCVTEFDRKQRTMNCNETNVQDVQKAEIMFYLQPWLEYADEKLTNYLASKGEFNIVADLFLVKKKYLQSLVWRVKALDQSEGNLRHSVVKIAEFYLSEIYGSDADSNDFKPALVLILQWVKKREYSFQILEDVLVSKLTKFSWDMINIFHKMDLYSSFSPNFVVKVFAKWNDSFSRKPEKKSSQCEENLPPITVLSTELIAELENSMSSTIYNINYSREKKVVVFACGHRFCYSVYKNDLVPELLSKFQLKRTVDIDVVKSTYSDDNEYLLCPVCVNSIYFSDMAVRC